LGLAPLLAGAAAVAEETAVKQADSAQAPMAAPAWIPAVDALFKAWDKPRSPGCALAVVQDGRVVHARGFGSAHLEHDIPISPETIFDIGSTSKQFTAACVGLLEQDGKLSIDDDVRKTIPELPDYGKTITLRMLLNHTSGLRDYCQLFSMSGQATENYTTRSTSTRTRATSCSRSWSSASRGRRCPNSPRNAFSNRSG
jgi:CubicO group peptidase (beta-lactamase class C family)